MKQPQPFFILTLIFILGIFLASLFRLAFIIFFIFCAFFLALGLLLKKQTPYSNWAFCLLVLFLGGAFFANAQIQSKAHISKYIYYQNTNLYWLKGVIDNPPEDKTSSRELVVRCEEIQTGTRKSNCRGKIKVLLKPNSNQDFAYGDEIMASGYLRPVYSRSQNYKHYLKIQDIAGTFYLESSSWITKLSDHKGNPVKMLALRWKNKTQGAIREYAASLSAGVVEAMLLGEKKNIPRHIYEAMMQSGTVHILVVSGFNVGIVAFVVHIFLKLVRIKRKVRILLSMPILVMYCLMTGASTPVVRATIMGLVFLCAYLVKREPDIYHSCALAALFILSTNPNQLFDIGFQLSFVSVLSIVFLYPKLRSLIRIETIPIKPLRFMVEGLLVSLSAWIGTAGIIFYYFKTFSPITPLANLLIVPLATLITLCGTALVFFAFTFAVLAPSFAATTDLLVMILVKLSLFLVKLPGACLKFS